ncbi:MAG: RHS repeat-associated core domain-containing protein [Candidatus Micrarchaeota archaeon]
MEAFNPKLKRAVAAFALLILINSGFSATILQAPETDSLLPSEGLFPGIITGDNIALPIEEPPQILPTVQPTLLPADEPTGQFPTVMPSPAPTEEPPQLNPTLLPSPFPTIEPSLASPTPSPLSSEASSTTIVKKTWYVYGNGLEASFNSDNNENYYINDHLGGSSVVLDTSGSVVASNEYYAFGTEKASAGETKFKFTGKELDDTGFYYYGARYYDPSIGRFLSADALTGSIGSPQSLNRYAYALNNPIEFIDPDGKAPQSIKDSITIIRGEDTLAVPLDSLTQATRERYGGHGSAYQSGSRGPLDNYLKWLSKGGGPGGRKIIRPNTPSQVTDGIYIPEVNQLGPETYMATKIVAMAVDMGAWGYLGAEYRNFMGKSGIKKGQSETEILESLNGYIRGSVPYSLENEIKRIDLIRDDYVDLGEFLFSSQIEGQRVSRGATCVAMSLATAAFGEALTNSGYLSGTFQLTGTPSHMFVTYTSETGKKTRVDPANNYVGQ